ncbi:glycerophosphodiester phosphodiesterase [Sediminibacterium goheungense]|nr:glycerophosphodiester phosphodiesterase family protein [Sediminibacterium goheungense]
MKPIIVLGLAIVSLCCSAQTNPNKMIFAKNPVVAHRGAFKAKVLPENSLAGLRNAIDMHCTGSEFDVWMTADDSLVVNHDPKFHELPIEQTKYADLLQFTLSNGEKIPTLHEYLSEGLKNNNETRLVLEIKPSTISKERGRVVAEKVWKQVQSLKATHATTYISFDIGILTRILELEPNAPTQYLNGDKTPEELKAMGIIGADYHFSVFKKNPDWIERAKKIGIILNAWTVNSKEDLQWALGNHFDFITTNEPELLFELLKGQ